MTLKCPPHSCGRSQPREAAGSLQAAGPPPPFRSIRKCDFVTARPPAVWLASALSISTACLTPAGHSPARPWPLRNICCSAYHANRLALRTGQVFSTPARKHQNHIALQVFLNRQSHSNDSYGLADNKTHITFAFGTGGGILSRAEEKQKPTLLGNRVIEYRWEEVNERIWRISQWNS